MHVWFWILGAPTPTYQCTMGKKGGLWWQTQKWPINIKKKHVKWIYWCTVGLYQWLSTPIVTFRPQFWPKKCLKMSFFGPYPTVLPQNGPGWSFLDTSTWYMIKWNQNCPYLLISALKRASLGWKKAKKSVFFSPNHTYPMK